jgi:transposase-like protein
LEYLFGEAKHQAKVITDLPNQRSCLKLLYATLHAPAQTWRGINVTAALLRVRNELKLVNGSAVRGQDEGFEETPKLHRFGVFVTLGVTLKTRNYLESIHALVGRRTHKVKHWHTSDHKQRWLVAAFLNLEPR